MSFVFNRLFSGIIFSPDKFGNVNLITRFPTNYVESLLNSGSICERNFILFVFQKFGLMFRAEVLISDSEQVGR